MSAQQQVSFVRPGRGPGHNRDHHRPGRAAAGPSRPPRGAPVDQVGARRLRRGGAPPGHAGTPELYRHAVSLTCAAPAGQGRNSPPYRTNGHRRRRHAADRPRGQINRVDGPGEIADQEGSDDLVADIPRIASRSDYCDRARTKDLRNAGDLRRRLPLVAAPSQIARAGGPRIALLSGHREPKDFSHQTLSLPFNLGRPDTQRLSILSGVAGI